MNNITMEHPDRKFIRFVNADYPVETQFYLEDGKDLEVFLNDGQMVKGPCKYIDSHHFEFQGSTWHISQFAEFNQKNGNHCRPVEYITELDLFQNKVKANIDSNPYYRLIDRMDTNKGYGLEFNPLAKDENNQVYFVYYDNKGEFKSSYMSTYDALKELDRYEFHVNPHDKALFIACAEEHVWNKEHLLAKKELLSSEILSDASEKIDEIITLAEDVIALAKETDPYEYMDNYETEEDLFIDVVRDITNGDVYHLIDWYQEIVVVELPGAEKAQDIIDRLNNFTPHAAGRKSIDALIQNADERKNNLLVHDKEEKALER